MTPSNKSKRLKWLVAAALAAVLALMAFLAWQSWRSIRQAKVDGMQLMAQLSAQGVERYLHEVSASLVLLGLRLREGAGLADRRRAQQVLAEYRRAHGDFQSVILARPDGQIIASSNTTAVSGLPSLGTAVSMAPREGESDLEPMVVRRVIWGPLVKRWVVPLRHAMLGDDGRPLAYVIATAPVEIIDDFVNRAKLAERMVVVLMRDDGYLLSRVAASADAAGEDIYSRPRTGAMRRHMLLNHFPPTGVFEGANSLGDATISGGFARIDGFPLTTGVYQPQAQLLRFWLDQMRYPLLASLLFFAAMVLVYRGYLKRELLAEGRRLAVKRELETLVEQRTVQLRALQGRLERAENEERRQIAHDLHDELGQTLAALRIRLSQLEDDDREAVRSVVAKMVGLVAQADASTRQLAARLVPPTLHTLGFSSALQSLRDELDRDFDLAVTLELDKLGVPLDHNVRDVLYRAVRELLINVAKHAGVHEATLQCRRDGDDILLRVADAGCGFDVNGPALPQAAGPGLAGMRERLLFIGVRCTLSSAPGRGTTVEIRLPLDGARLIEKDAVE